VNKRISISFTISLIVNFLLVILVCVAGLRIDEYKQALAEKPVAMFIDRPVLQVVEKPYPVMVMETRFIELPPEIIEKTVYVEKIITENVTVDTRDFESAEELLTWLENDNLDTLPYVKGVFECENFADSLKRRAKEAGYTMDLQYYSKGTKLPMSDIVLKGAHAMNSTVIGNEIWLIDAMSDKAWVAFVRE